jgi:hypothetical protein
MLSAPFLPPLLSWLELLLPMRLCLRARVCSLRGSCVALCLLSRCRLCLSLLGVARFCSASLGVLRPKPHWGKAWSPTWFFFTCSSKGRNHQKPQTHPAEHLVEKIRGGNRQDRDSSLGGRSIVAEFKVISSHIISCSCWKCCDLQSPEHKASLISTNL